MVIAHLYKDLMNLYGNDGNIKVIRNKLEQMGIKAEYIEPSIGDNIDLSNCDLIFVGSGTERSQLLAAEDIKRHKEELRNCIDDGKVVIAMGNSLDLFGNKLISDNGDVVAEGLGIFDFDSVHVKRIKKEVRRESSFQDSELLGFENHEYVIKGEKYAQQEVMYKGFYGAYVEGPILVRNPELLTAVLMKLTGLSQVELQEKGLCLEPEKRAYENFIKVLNGEIV